jgi:hypothetical protein
VQADILITVDDGFTLYINGNQLGNNTDIWTFAERFCVALQPCLNVFAVTAVNTGGAAGLLASIQITYSDGTISTIVSDTTWRYSITVPSGYEQLSFDASSWAPAISEGVYGVSPWAGGVAIPSTPTVLSLANAGWIWTNEVVNTLAPAGPRAFRRKYTPPAGQTATSATIIITADNEYDLYVNGVLVGSGNNWEVAQTYTVNLAPATSVVFAVYAVNLDLAAGVLASIQVNSASSECNCTSSAFLMTDTNWKSNLGTYLVSFNGHFFFSNGPSFI